MKRRLIIILSSIFLLLPLSSVGAQVSGKGGKEETYAKILIKQKQVIYGKQRITLNFDDPDLLFVEFIIDGKRVAVDNEKPYECHYDFGDKPTTHEVVVIGYYSKRAFEKRLERAVERGKREEKGEQEEAKKVLFSVKITSPKGGSYLAGKKKIIAEVKIPPGEIVSRVEFYVNKKLIATDREPPYETTYDFGNKFNRQLIEVIAYTESGKKASDAIVSLDLEGFVFKAKVELVTLDVTVTDKRGRYISGLGKDDFLVYEDGVLQKVTHFSREKRPLVVGILIDASGSMRGSKINRAKEAAIRFIKNLADEDQAFVMSFADTPKLLEPLTGNRERLISAIRSISAAGATALNQAVYDALKLLGEKHGRKAIILLSDGYDTVGKIDEEKVLEEAKRTNVKIYSVGIMGYQLAPPMPLSKNPYVRNRGYGEVVLKSLADWTGGEAFFPNSLGELVRIYQGIADDLKTQYSLGYVSTNQKRDGKFRTIKVLLKKKSLKARTRKGYYAPSEVDRR
ncbi:MAG: VWA domain-containing protein [Acidobacteria bacterium]|nr:VWA domain-containing protein [Acidobacteriota bacterium]